MSDSDDDILPLTVAVDCTNETLRIVLADGREIAVPTAWFPRLLNATDAQRQNWRVCGGGYGITWEDVDEDISIERLFKLK